MSADDVRLAQRVKIEDQRELLAAELVAIGASETIAEALGGSLPTGTEMVKIGPVVSTEIVNFNPTGRADATNAALPAGLLEVHGTPLTVGEVFADSKNLNIWCYGRIRGA